MEKLNSNLINNKERLQPTITRERLKTIPLSELKPEYKTDGRYYRYQRDKQRFITRTDEQKKIVDEYFIIKNVKTLSCEPSYRTTALVMKILSAVAFLVAALALLISIINEEDPSLPLMIGGIVAGFIFIVIKSFFMKKFDSGIRESERPKKVMTDIEYEAEVNKKIESLNIAEMALERLGLDQSQIEEVKPIIIKNRALLDTSLRHYSEKDDRIHSSTQVVTVLYFSAEQIFVYKLRFDMCCNEKTEWTWEFFYDDICDITTTIDTRIVDVAGSDDTKEKGVQRGKKAEFSSTNIEIIATNSKMDFAIESDDEVFSSIMAMKQKIRDRRNV